PHRVRGRVVDAVIVAVEVDLDALDAAAVDAVHQVAADRTRRRDRLAGVDRVDRLVDLVLDRGVDVVGAVGEVGQVPGHGLRARIGTRGERADLEPVVPLVVGVGEQGDRRLAGEPRADRVADRRAEAGAGVRVAGRRERDAYRRVGDRVGELPGQFVRVELFAAEEVIGVGAGQVRAADLRDER